jgi:hypothetical protein
VRVNDVELVKPMVFPNKEIVTESKEYAIHPIKESLRTSQGTLSFRGYMYSQHGIISPREYIGVLIRIKNVAIGGFDRTFLEYPSASNQLFRNWISGEIYVDEGLENAMNINRSSFKVTHPDYIALRDWLHRFLDEIVFRHVLSEYYLKNRNQRQKDKEASDRKAFVNIIESEMGSKYKFQYGTLPEEEAVRIDKEKGLVIVNEWYPLFYRMPKKFQNIVQRMFILFEIAAEKSGGDVSKLRKKFKEEIEKWINAE